MDNANLMIKNGFSYLNRRTYLYQKSAKKGKSLKKKPYTKANHKIEMFKTYLNKYTDCLPSLQENTCSDLPVDDLVKVN